MANTSMSPKEVKSVCDGLECSPSQHDEKGYHGGKPSISPTAHNSTAATGGTHLKTSTSEFQKTDRGRTLPNYKGQFARKAEQA